MTNVAPIDQVDREKSILANTSNPYIVKMYYSFTSTTDLYLVPLCTCLSDLICSCACFPLRLYLLSSVPVALPSSVPVACLYLCYLYSFPAFVCATYTVPLPFYLVPLALLARNGDLLCR